jgi:CRISPR/Cas system Type II protein with McrA/HNH and RuvC-like nuclease domain
LDFIPKQKYSFFLIIQNIFFIFRKYFLIYIKPQFVMTRILGLDLGTNSIGWAVVDKEKNEFSLIDKGVRIFQEGVKIEKGIESSKAAERTKYRSARRIKYRRKLRKNLTFKL